MNKSWVLLIFILLLGMGQFLNAQEKKPKVAVVLSGGGAKGIAHIPLLQKLDSLGIVPDLIVGTSMGSIVGGIYSIGYSGDSIATMVKSVDWDELLGGDISLVDVSAEEKSEFKRYLIDFDVIEGKPKVSSGILKDQKLREFLARMSYPVIRVTDFDDLPIPYRAMTTDIVNGKEILLDSGSIAMAMRASMSIPGVFKPVEYKNTLLVDGGVMNNFPVDKAIELGADIVIGSDVGGGMQKKKDLDNITSLIFQAGMLTSNLKNPASREACDILLDHMPYLTYSTGDFNKSNEIYNEGLKATNENLDQLVALAEKLKKFEQRPHELPESIEEVVIDSIVYEGFSKANLKLVKARTELETGRAYKPDELMHQIDIAMGTTLFNQIGFSRFFKDDEMGVEIKGSEHSKHQIKGSLHYDSYRSVGLLANYTGRNVLGKASRILVSLDIAVQPRFRVQYQKIFGEQMNWWWRSEVLGEFLDQKIYLQGEVAESMNSDYIQFDNQINRNLKSLHSYIGVDLSYEYSKVRPKVDPEIADNILNLEKYRFTNFEIGLHYRYSDMDQVFYPRKGLILGAGVSRSLFHDVNMIYSQPELPNANGSTNGFTKVTLDFEKRHDFNKKVTGILGLNARFIFEDQLKDNLSFSDYGYAAKYFLGGVWLAPRKSTLIFPGLHEDELNVNQLMNLSLGVQFSPFAKMYITPHANVASVGFEDFKYYIEDAFSPSGNWSEGFETSMVASLGATLAYHSFLGPVTFDFSYVNDVDKLRLFFGLGIQLNRSN